ncbi:TPA: hypothetical protein ACSQMU_005261 [Pseudomonas aeruginosa]|nr:hypothetical protein [Pseudomonas aeruginosa]
MSEKPECKFKRCYISAPFGLDLGSLPELLADRDVSWEWAKDEPLENEGVSERVAASDFVLIVLNGTKSDYRGAFESGLAVGLGKPVLLIQTKARSLPLDYSLFAVIKTSLHDRDALKFHLDLFLASPPASSAKPKRIKSLTPALQTKPRQSSKTFDSVLEQRVFEAVIAAGGSAISQPPASPDVKYRPDLLAWLGHLEPEYLDPVAIEVKSVVNVERGAQVDQRLGGFIQSARLKMALVVTDSPMQDREQLLPNIIWLDINTFELLARSGQLGVYVRETRNRIVHGVR